MRILQKASLIVADLLLILTAFYLSLLIRFEFEGLGIPLRFLEGHIKFYAVNAFICIITFYLFSLYDKVWRYAGVQELVNILKAVTASYLPMVVWSFAVGGNIFPRSSVIIAWLLTFFFIGGIRFALRLSSEVPQILRAQGKKILIVGANDAGEMTLRELQRYPGLGYLPVGFVDDDKTKQKLTIHGVPVIGRKEDIPRLVQEKEIEEIIIALPSPSLVRGVVSLCQKLKVKLKIVPSLSQIIDGKFSVSQIREVEIEDLLEREPVKLDMARVSSYLYGKKVLVTGAGGSIGSEICRQVIGFHPSELVLMGRGENSIYEISIELKNKTNVPLVNFIGDMRDKARMEYLFSRYRPEVVFHAAAHKHVPLMEENVPEAVSNNVFGTMNLLDLSDKFGVERFIFLSTDKAVNPTSVMGTSKRLAEICLKMKATASKTRFMAVRFGNVLDSRGSVVPTFRRQIAMGGPVTVTHPDMTRYFMTIPEGVQLVIQAGALGEGGEIFILDMGKPVKIMDLARNMIKLSGFEPEKDIPIQVLGIRPGEKLTEELVNIGENTNPTEVEKIFKVKTNIPDFSFLQKSLGDLRKSVESENEEELKKKMKEIITNYIAE